MATASPGTRQAFDVVWAWEEGPLSPGMTAVLRVKNEARSLPWVLPPLFGLAHEVILVDNRSTDGTADVARRVAAEHGASDKLVVKDYPFDVSRCGSEHLATHADSVHSLAHFYNWSFSHVRTTYSMKWDGDMVLTREGVLTLRDLAHHLEPVEAVVAMPRHSLFLESDRVGYLDLGLRNVEPWIYPNGPGYRFLKAFEWELRHVPKGTERVMLPEGLCVELKHLDQDEFDHWTSPEDFASSSRTPRKRREWESFHAIRDGRADSVPGLVRITAPEGVHVIDHVCETWLPSAPRPLGA